MKRLLVCFALITATPLLADSSMPASYWANRQLPDPQEEAQALALMHELRCLVCQGQSIADSDAEIAGDMRHLVRSRIAAGEQPTQIRDWLIARYGNWVSFRPPAEEPIGWPLWAAPLLLLIGGILLARSRIRKRR